MYWLLWGAPVVLVAIGALTGASARAALWTSAFFIMGCACVANAARCGRLHCFLTGPLFLACGVLSLLVGLGQLALGWGWIAFSALGGTVLAYVPEWMRGRYDNGRNEKRS